LKKFLKYALLVYLVLCGLFYFYQHLFYFQPKKLDVKHALTFPVRIRFQEAKIKFDSATEIDLVKFLPNTPKPQGVVLFFHGNRYNVEHYSTYAPYFTRRGYECWMPDYPGYGRSTGETSIAALKELSIQLYKMANARYASDSILIYGKSLGSGVGAYLASKRDCKVLMLETPYESISNLTSEYLFMLPVKWLLHDDLETGSYLGMVAAPIVAWHGDKDELIPLSQAIRLTKVMKPSDKFMVIPGADHNGIPASASYHQSLDSSIGTEVMLFDSASLKQ
jgi:pimeloyl-ACP methyl ester carboxylesterase